MEAMYEETTIQSILCGAQYLNGLPLHFHNKKTQKKSSKSDSLSPICLLGVDFEWS